MTDSAAAGPSPAQLEILQVIWEAGEATVRDVHQALATRKDVARNTVLTLMNRLVDKGWLRRRQEGTLFKYAATATRQQVLGNIVTQLVDGAFNGSPEDLFLTLVDSRGLTSAEAARIRELLEQKRRGGPREPP